jgi:predicted  nucleic acid-binding Zn-ribbon protein
MYIKMLWDFEQKEKKVKNKEHRIEEIGTEVQIFNEINRIEDEIKEIKSAKDGFLKRKKEIEIELEENESQLEHVASLIKENKLKTSKELKTAKKTEESLTTKQNELKKNLEFMTNEIREKDEFIEEYSKKIEKMNETIAEIKKERKKLEKELKSETKILNEEFAKLKEVIPQIIVQGYEMIKENYPEETITTTDHGFCKNCGVQLPLEIAEELKKGEGAKIIQCEVCGKILYYPEELK